MATKRPEDEASEFMRGRTEGLWLADLCLKVEEYRKDPGVSGRVTGIAGVTLTSVDGKSVADGKIARTIPFRVSADETFDVAQQGENEVID